jgi:hypothetical protein
MRRFHTVWAVTSNYTQIFNVGFRLKLYYLSTAAELLRNRLKSGMEVFNLRKFGI